VPFGHDREAVSKQVLRFLKLLESRTWAVILMGATAQGTALQQQHDRQLEPSDQLAAAD